MPPYGAGPDVERREQVAKLRGKGLTFTQIGKRLHMSRQAAHSLLHRSGKSLQLPGIVCRECGKEICSWNAKWRGGMKRAQLVYCLQCLGKHGEVRIGERLLAFRINSGMTRGDLEKETGVDRNTIGQCERDGSDPFWSTMARLVEYFGPKLLGLEGGRNSG
jgi:DNA-binding XRE family transcriptional regulator